MNGLRANLRFRCSFTTTVNPLRTADRTSSIICRYIGAGIILLDHRRTTMWAACSKLLRNSACTRNRTRMMYWSRALRSLHRAIGCTVFTSTEHISCQDYSFVWTSQCGQLLISITKTQLSLTHRAMLLCHYNSHGWLPKTCHKLSINQSFICIRPMVHIKEEKIDNKKKK